ncbi:hypothetical protein EDD22DRAFT_845147 [Suillus occidentalis]|nr:hypothetical protein EDD22DRAFT_845147 [Suillus occidentalis]
MILRMNVFDREVLSIWTHSLVVEHLEGAHMQVQSYGRSKTTARKTPAPAPAPAIAAIPSSSYAVPRAALNVPMPDLHSMAIAIRDGAARIAILEAHVREQDDGRPAPLISTSGLTCQCNIFAGSIHSPALHSPLPSALPNLINLDMGVMEPTPLKVEDASDMVGLMFEPSQVQSEDPQSSSEIVIPDDPGNLFPEYNSVSEEMDVEVKARTSGEEVEMAT